MGGLELKVTLGPVDVTATQVRRAAIHIADRIGSQHPSELDDLMPRLAGKQTAHKPGVADDVLELLDIVLGTRTNRPPEEEQ
jgi:hypothetical protein